MKRLIITLAWLLSVREATAQLDFDFDRKVYQVLYPDEFCKLVASDRKILLLDVRSSGEYNDTSRYSTLNIGRLKGAININIDDLDSLKTTLESYKNSTIVTYCSHSQRSRRAAKLLMENGFTDVRNLNGGMTWLNLHAQEISCMGLMEHHTAYGLISARLFIEKSREKNSILIDVRNKEQFEGKDTLEWANTGRFKHALNIPYGELRKYFTTHPAEKQKDIFIYDLDGSLSTGAALQLDSMQIRSTILPGGLYNFIRYEKDPGYIEKYVNFLIPYQMLNAYSCMKVAEQNKNLVTLDCRPIDEFESRSKDSWRNIGIIKGAIHVGTKPDDNQLTKAAGDKSKPVLVYGNSEAWKVSRRLTGLGYKKVYFLYGGIWSLVWAQANVKDFNADSLVERRPVP